MTTKTEKGDWILGRVMTRSAWLKVKDAFGIQKFRIYMGNYQRGKGASAQATAYVDVDALRVVFSDLALRGSLPENLYPNRSIEFFGGSERDGNLEARITRICEKPHLKNPIIFEIAYGPGRRNRNGGIQPAGKLENVSIMLDRWSARRLAHTVLGELAAYESATVMSRRRASERETAAELEAHSGQAESTTHIPEYQRLTDNDPNEPIVLLDDPYRDAPPAHEPERPSREADREPRDSRRTERREAERDEPREAERAPRRDSERRDSERRDADRRDADRRDADRRDADRRDADRRDAEPREAERSPRGIQEPRPDEGFRPSPPQPRRARASGHREAPSESRRAGPEGRSRSRRREPEGLGAEALPEARSFTKTAKALKGMRGGR